MLDLDDAPRQDAKPIMIIKRSELSPPRNLSLNTKLLNYAQSPSSKVSKVKRRNLSINKDMEVVLNEPQQFMVMPDDTKESTESPSKFDTLLENSVITTTRVLDRKDTLNENHVFRKLNELSCE